jgi:hypothetical protein
MHIRHFSSFFLGIMVITAVANAPVRAQMQKGDPAEEFGVRIARLKYGGGGNWYNDPSSLPNLATELERRVGIPTNKEEKVVSLTDENLRAFPFIYMTGNGTVRLSPEERWRSSATITPCFTVSTICRVCPRSTSTTGRRRRPSE